MIGRGTVGEHVPFFVPGAGKSRRTVRQETAKILGTFVYFAKSMGPDLPLNMAISRHIPDCAASEFSSK